MMKRNRWYLAAALAALTGSYHPPVSAQESVGTSLPPRQLQSSIGKISDAPKKFTDLEDASIEFEPPTDLRPDVFRDNEIKTDPVEEAFSSGWNRINDAEFVPAESVNFSRSIDAAANSSPCGTSVCGPAQSMGVYSCGPDRRSRWWAETETLLWFARQGSAPTLAATGPQGTVANLSPAIGGTSNLGGDLLPGYRANIGMWFDDCESIGAGGRVFGLFDGDSDQTITSDGTTTLAVPFFDALLGPQTYLVAFDAGALGRDTGSVTVSQEIDLVSAEAYGRFRLAGNRQAYSDFIAGYTFLNFDNATSLRTVSVDGITNTTPNGTVTTTLDTFGVDNTFHGGHLGLLNSIDGGCCTLSTLAKVALGNMSSSSRISGSITEDAPGPSITTTSSGLLTGATNIGTTSRDRFSFIPELGTKLRVGLTDRLDATVGYTLLVLPDVGVGSDLITGITDATGLGGLPQTSGGVLRDQTFYIQGVDLGVSYNF